MLDERRHQPLPSSRHLDDGVLLPVQHHAVDFQSRICWQAHYRIFSGFLGGGSPYASNWGSITQPCPWVSVGSTTVVSPLGIMRDILKRDVYGLTQTIIKRLFWYNTAC